MPEKNYTWVPCADCKKPVKKGYVSKGVAKTVQRCRNCFNKINHGAGHPCWTGKTITNEGYVLIRADGHPFATKKGYVCEHRLVMEKKLGRYLTPREVIHHRDGNPQNNDIDNLVLCKGHSEHRRLHIKEPNCKVCGDKSFSLGFCYIHYRKLIYNPRRNERLMAARRLAKMKS